MESNETGALVAAILNDAWMVRHYRRGGRVGVGKLQRAQAIQKLGVTVRNAFNASTDYETLLAALVDGLRPRDEPPPF